MCLPEKNFRPLSNFTRNTGEYVVQEFLTGGAWHPSGEHMKPRVRWSKQYVLCYLWECRHASERNLHHVHCSGHCLNLVTSHSSTLPEIRNELDKHKHCRQFFQNRRRINGLLQLIVSNKLKDHLMRQFL